MSKRIGSINIEELFHGTKRAYVRSICTDNFDWRRCGESVGNKFGHGISFSPISNYATYYADESCDNRVMLLVHVLVGNEIIGSANMRLPPDGYDTSIKPNRHVVVKYEDNEFYPAYKITYRCTNPRELENRRLQKRKNGRGRGRGPRRVARQRYYN
ncbi:Poly(ADP-ribose) polymerase catalytic domain [Popillia japonica]|uniref:Poly [ADP-ribose] polymerase n=1 Tax=Popillia japonica TaxID=7064 RepID=A0AAW1N445_POPJA